MRLSDCSLYDEKALLIEIAAGDDRAFRKLYDLYKERFYSLALKMTRSDEVAQDIVQDVFLSIWNRRKCLAEVDRPYSYFFTAVYRRIYQHYRTIALERKLSRVVPFVNESVNTTDEMVLARESGELISRAIAKLPPRQRLVFKLTKQEGLSREDVARRLQVSPNTVKNHLADALKFIRAFLRNTNYIFLIISWFFK